MKIVLCIEKYTIGTFTFKEGEAYLANMVNEDYWVIESVGVPTEEFNLHFEVQEDVPSGVTKNSTEANNKRFVEEEEMFKEILKSFGYEDMIEDTKPKKKTFWGTIKEWWNEWEIIEWYE